ncbi:glutamate--tRNA ligase [Elioraea sp. Yellowstone]|jgi:glutamyl-tRNA synthetase|uniref:glutamate--tRNA ligase n=1 Tax=Elioraea sp. Yellowstone TaxID=2592070 RepID=UPI00114DC6DF|nr:glutamate--tRNA ligase [Elioraea sp. Yellowstone]TQF79401.1 glutamate--tRNA ligase [Elioraea sp. Yellowstone]
MSVVTRFAPSPTGFLHIGGARTALYNWLFARRHGGRYLLRIEDTDTAREVPGAVEQIIESLTWLGIPPDEPPVSQRSRQERHAEVARQLVAQGRAYYAYETAEELQAMRERALAEGRPPRYDGAWRDRDPAEAPPGVAGAIRLKAPREGETVVEDRVQGTVRVANAELDDMIILRSDGRPTYLHAVVVDDHDMGITHVIRGDDHLTNTFRQCQIYDAMGWPRPVFAHIPLIHGQDGAKLSKRHGAVSVLDFRDQGYLPEAVANYLLRLGWGYGDIEVIAMEEAARIFDLADVGRAAARFDYQKLAHLNGIWLRRADDDRLTRLVLERLARRTEGAVGAVAAERITRLMPGLKERARTLEDLTDSAAFLARTVPLPFEPKAAALLTPEARIALRELARAWDGVAWEPAALEAATRAHAEARSMKLKDLAMPLRAALTGSTTSPPVFDVAAALGRTETLARIAAVTG